MYQFIYVLNCSKLGKSWISFDELFSRRSYYLLVALTSEGQLIFEEDRDGSAAYGVRLNDRNFLNGARHSVYYVRDNNTANLLVSYIIYFILKFLYVIEKLTVPILIMCI